MVVEADQGWWCSEYVDMYGFHNVSFYKYSTLMLCSLGYMIYPYLVDLKDEWSSCGRHIDLEVDLTSTVSVHIWGRHI